MPATIAEDGGAFGSPNDIGEQDRDQKPVGLCAKSKADEELFDPKLNHATEEIDRKHGQ